MTIEIIISPEPSLSPYQVKSPKAPDIVNDNFFGSFADLLDVINPLQHIPGVSTIYQALSGDTLSTGAQIAGGALFGGPLGLIASIANAIVEEETGKNVGQNLFAAVTAKYQQVDESVS